MPDPSHTALSVKQLLRLAWPLLAISFLEGAALMAVELIGAKLLAPWYGSSIYVWSAVLGMTLGGLALGYFGGAAVLKRVGGRSPKQVLSIVLAGGAFISLLLPFYSPVILSISIALGNLQLGILFATLFILVPPLLLFGMVSPLVIHLLSAKGAPGGRATGLVYGISTLGGILATFLFAFQFMPYLGLTLSCLLVAVMLLIGFLFNFLRFFH